MKSNTANKKWVVTMAPTLARITTAALAMVSLLYSGCAICCGPYDYHYPTFGGTVQRADPVWGRVGSLYSDPGPFGGPSADSNLDHAESLSPSGDVDGGTEFEDELDPIEPPEKSGDPDSSGVLPPPNNGRPGPDDSTSIRRLRNQSRQAWPRWR